MRRKTRRRKRRRKGGVAGKSGTTRRERRRLALNERRRRRRFERALPEGEYPNFANLVAKAKERAQADDARIKWLADGDKKKFPFGRNDNPEKMHGGRQYPKSRTHVYSRATPTHNIGRTKRSKSRRSRKSRRSKSRSKSRRSRSRRRSRRSN